MRKRLPLLFLLLLALVLTACGLPEPTQPRVETTSGNLTVSYVDVGQADCALLTCGGESMLIDGGNVADSDLVVSFLEQQGVEELAAVVCSHAHEDHAGGLAGVLAVYPTQAVYAPTRTYSSKCYDDFLYYVDQQGLTVTIPEPGDSFALGDATVTVLGPVKSYPDTNNTSLVLRVDYGDTRFLFTGDMERDAEQDLLDSGADVQTDVLKVGHHGSDTSTSYRFLYAVNPEAAVISVGAGNSYGHPHDEPLSRLRDAGAVLYRTDNLGTVTAVSDGETVTFTLAKQSAVPETPGEIDYIGNVNSKVFHLPTCTGLPKEENRVYFDTLESATAAGYHSCTRCLG